MKILIIRFSSMGDVILTAPLFSYLKEHNPEAELYFVTNALYQDFFRDDPRLFTVIPYSREKEDLIFSDLATMKWNRLIDLQNNRRTRSLRKKYFRRVKQGLFDKLHLQRFLLLYFRINLYGKQNSVVERYIKAAHESPVQNINIPPLSLFFKNEEPPRKLLMNAFGKEKRPVIALIPFCSWKNKQWPLESFAEVGKHFAEKGWRIVILGGPEDIKGAENIKTSIGEQCHSFAGDIKLYEAGGILKQCTLALGNDTGLSHLARSCGVNTGIIYGATTGHFGFFPYGEPSYEVFQSREFCRPCHPHGGNFCWRLSRPCLGNIQVHTVIERLERLL